MSGFKVVRQTKSPQEMKVTFKKAFKKTVEVKKGEKSAKDKIEISRGAEKLSDSKESDKAKKSGEIKKRLYGTATKKVGGITSTLLNLHSPRVGFAANSHGSTQAPREFVFAKKADAHKLGIEILKYKIPGLTTINGFKETTKDKDAQEAEFSTLA